MTTRRNFLRNSTALFAAAPLMGAAALESQYRVPRATGRILNAYYLRAQMYTMVPRQIAEDMKWMAGAGTDVVTISVLEQDLWAAERNIDTICEAARKAGMEVWADASRWGGLVAGAPKVPSLFTVCHPDGWVLKKDGTPVFDTTTAGAVSSIYHPGTRQFFCETADKFLTRFPFTGWVWDEPKHVGADDRSRWALKTLGERSSYEQRVAETVKFFSAVNAYLRERHPAVKLSLFVFANSSDTVIREMATVSHLDYYGCDGRPWSNADGGDQESAGKTLVDNGGKFIREARTNKTGSLFLIENHNLAKSNFELLASGIPQVIAMRPDQLIYYYYPRNVEDVDAEMEIVRREVRKFHAGQ
jgi:hypothetical protein